MVVTKRSLRYMDSINNIVTSRVSTMLAQLLVVESNLQRMAEETYRVVDPELAERIAGCKAIAEEARKIMVFTRRAATKGVDVEGPY